MNYNSYNIQMPMAWYYEEGKFFEGNEAFKKLFGKPTDNERLEILINNSKKNNQYGYATELLWNEGREYMAIICPYEIKKVVGIYVIDTDALDNVYGNLSKSKKVEQEFFDILESLHDDFVIISNKGIIEKVLPSFDELYGISSADAIGRSVQEMEEREIFNPSVALRVLKSLKAEVMLQKISSGAYLMCTAIPIFDREGNLHKVISYTRNVTKYENLKDEYRKLEETVYLYTTQLEQLKKEHEENTKIKGNSKIIRRIINMIDRVSKFDTNVLLTGESGVGKTMFAEAIHNSSNRKEQPFITINCGAIPENLLESELFGYEKGAFTGANQDGKAGLIEMAHNGTLFLDEIGDLPLLMQVKLLKVIQDKKVTRVGGIKEKSVDFRLVSASNKDLIKLIGENKFREDLYYRLNVLSIHIPPLRDRKEDIFFLITHFLNKFNEKYKVSHTFSNKAINYLELYSWPGNIRELENVIERMVIITDDYIINEDMLPQNIYTKDSIGNYDTSDKTLKEILEQVEKNIITKCYEEHKTSTQVAKVLGISQPSASLKIKKYIDKIEDTIE